MTTAPDHAVRTPPARAAGIRGAAESAFDTLTRADAQIGARELGLATLALLIAGFVLYGSHIAHGSFYYDDWANASLTAYPPHSGFAGALSEYWQNFGFRPLVALYVPTLHEVLGLHEHWFIAWSVLLLCAMPATLYFALRTLGLERIHAIAIAALTLVSPFPDSTTLWSTASTAHLVIVLYLLGVVLAVHAFRARGRRRERWLHVASLVLFALAVTTYELVATVALGSVLIYLWQTTPRKALSRFVADVIVIGLALVWTGSQTGIDEVKSTSGGLQHAHLLFTQGLQIIARSIEPFGSPPRAAVLAIAAAVLAVGGAAWRFARLDERTKHDLGRWLAVALAGLLFAYVAWAVFIPSDPYYEPTGLGVGNRVNALAVIGLAALTYSLAMIVGALVFHGTRRGPTLAIGVGLTATLAIGLNFAHRTRVDIYQWDLATQTQSQVFAALHHGIPQPPAHSTIYAYGFPNFTAPGVPSFAASWDLNGATKLTYRDPTLSGYPVFLPTDMVCTKQRVYPDGNGYTAADFGTAYGRAYLLDVASGVAVRPSDQAQCDTALGLPAPAHSS